MNKKIPICIIDDDAVFCTITSMIIRKMFPDARISIFQDGEEALAYIESNPLCCILLDINMPIMDGWEFLTELSKRNISQETKIYILSSSIDPIDLDKAEKNSLITGFIEKPLSVAQIKEIFENSESSS